jgi:uncharacterized coiled-coil protein SlyX
MKARLLSVFVVAAMLFPGAAWAAEADMMLQMQAEMKALESRVASLEMKLEEQNCCILESKKCLEEQRKEISEYKEKVKEMGLSPLLVRPERNGLNVAGFKIGAGMTGVGQYSPNTNSVDTGKGKDAFDGTFSSDIGISKDVGEHGEAFLHMEYGQPGAPGVESEMNVYPFTGVNRDADTAGFRISEAWYEHKLFDDKLTVTGGKLDATIYFDDNACANDETTQFLNRMFRNNSAIEFPDDNGPGVRVAIAPVDMLEVSAGVFDAAGNWEKMNTNLFTVGQVNVRPNFMEKEGNYRFIVWNNNKSHTDIMDPTMDDKANYGYALSCDQVLWDPITVFSRFGWQEPKVSTVEYSWSTGVQVSGSIWKRPDDVFGVAVGQAIPGYAYKKSRQDMEAGFQTNLEVYYNLKVNDNLSLSPDAQFIFDPNGGDPNDSHETISVYGVRAQVDF